MLVVKMVGVDLNDFIGWLLLGDFNLVNCWCDWFVCYGGELLYCYVVYFNSFEV